MNNGKIKSRWIVKYIVILAASVIVTAIVIPYGIYQYFIFTYTDFKVIEKIPAFNDFPKVWSFEEGKIINTAREKYIFPDDPLEYKVTIHNPQGKDRQLAGTLMIFKGGELKGNPIKTDLLIRGNDKFQVKTNFFLKEEGTYKLEYEFVFDSDLPGSDHPNHAFIIENIQVQSLSNKLLADANISNFWNYVAILASAIGGNIISLIYLRKQSRQTDKQLSLTKKELESRLKADLEVSVGESNLNEKGDKWEGTVKIIVRNNGNISARNVNVHFKDPTSALDLPQLIRDEEEIKKSSFPIPGSIPSHLHYPEHIIHTTTLDESRPYDLAIWISYDYADVKNMEFIQIVKINSQSNSVGPLYGKEDIENEKGRLRRQGF
ncbi:MAG: hypothetical protein AUH84_07370 [Thaumarchaeota archaeon 13_1_40CM_4_38_7]|nr:MAG: hypothetical protein AUH84_07370 [Thaumarchaeota archaeon 13_1_40CM_4_38_7]OLC93259.1 MAG: hypothetical protein AUI92_03315 [Thaumarchaeota archaeon 13_1_40CM_3_38_6]